MELKGVYPIVPTPFHPDGSVDAQSVERLARFMADREVNGLAVLGALGEGHKLTETERFQTVSAFKAALPPGLGLVVGVRAPADHPAAVMAETARDLGADAVLLGPPPVQKDPALLGYYQRVSEAAGLPVIIHDYPAATGVTMTPDLIAEIFQTCPNVEYIKLEDPPTGAKMAEVWKRTGRDLKVFGALGGMYALEELERGAVGIMTGFAYPELLVELYRKHQAGQIEAARNLFYDLAALIRFEFQPGIGVSLRKHVLVHRGVFASPTIRRPGPEADPVTIEQLFRIVDHLKARGHRLD